MDEEKGELFRKSLPRDPFSDSEEDKECDHELENDTEKYRKTTKPKGIEEKLVKESTERRKKESHKKVSLHLRRSVVGTSLSIILRLSLYLIFV